MATTKVTVCTNTTVLSADVDLRADHLEATQVQCCTLFSVGDPSKVGIRNNCPTCRNAVVSWSPSVGIRYYRVEGHNQLTIDVQDITGVIIGENPC
jgi:hypothetical protein